MAKGTLHAGKPEGARRRRNSPTHDTTVLVPDGVVRGRSLQEATGKAEWLPQVVEWWETWRRSPQAQVFEETDWVRLAMIAPFVQACWIKPSAAAMAEIRMTEERLGATHVDRMRARMRIDRVEDDTAGGGEGGNVVSISASRRDVAARLAEDEE